MLRTKDRDWEWDGDVSEKGALSGEEGLTFICSPTVDPIIVDANDERRVGISTLWALPVARFSIDTAASSQRAGRGVPTGSGLIDLFHQCKQNKHTAIPYHADQQGGALGPVL